jgi:hypothetical protein
MKAILVLLFFVLSCNIANAAPPANASGKFSEWFLAQRQIDGVGLCCGDEAHLGGDGHYVDVRNNVDLGGYDVKLDELGWIHYPYAVDPTYPNPTGRNVVWYAIYAPGNPPVFFCLRVSNGG